MTSTEWRKQKMSNPAETPSLFVDKDYTEFEFAIWTNETDCMAPGIKYDTYKKAYTAMMGIKDSIKDPIKAAVVERTNFRAGMPEKLVYHYYAPDQKWRKTHEVDLYPAHIVFAPLGYVLLAFMAIIFIIALVQEFWK